MLKWILHDWDDDDALRILRAVRKSMTAEARLVVLERVVGDARATDARTRGLFWGKEEAPRPSSASGLRETPASSVSRRITRSTATR